MTFVGSTREERHKSSDILVIEAAENEVLKTPGNVAGVVEATYGADSESERLDVKTHVMGPMLLGEPIHVSNSMFGENPCPGQLKTLRVRYMPRQDFIYRVTVTSAKSSGGSARVTRDFDSVAHDECKLELVCPRLFHSVREVLKLDQRGYFNSISNLKEGGKQASGKSGASFFFTVDGRFCLKSVTDTEIATLAGLLPDFIVHLQDHPESLLTRYLGAYRLTLSSGAHMTLVAMNNVFEGAPRLDAMYDLKGTTEDRWVNPAPGRCLKDNNFVGINIYLEDEVAKRFNTFLGADITFLEKRKIMDYSLMLGIVNCEDVVDGQNGTSNIVASYSALMGGLRATTAKGMLAEDIRDCYIFLGIVDMLVTYGVKKVAANYLKSATIGLRNEIDTVPPDRYGDRFREHFRRRILGRSEQVTLTPVPIEVFEIPLQPMSRSGGTAAFFRVRYKESAADSDPRASQSREYWIGKDLSRAHDEVMFYEEAKPLRDKQEWELLRWMTPYGGICRMRCQVKDGEEKDTQIVLLRNCRDGYSSCRMLDVKIGVATAVAGWQGKSAFAAWTQSCLDKVTNSAGHGSRLEGFDSPPQTLRSFQALLTSGAARSASLLASTQQLKRFHLQCMRAAQYLPLFLDLHSAGAEASQAPAPEKVGSLTEVETQELVLLDLIQQLAGFVAACRKVAVPQQWIGSSVMLCFDCEELPPRKALTGGPQSGSFARCHIFDWGRSELNTEPKHLRLSVEDRARREKHWGHYCGGVAKLLYDCCALYASRFWSPPRSVSLSLLGKNALSSDVFIGTAVLPFRAASRTKATLATPGGEAVTVGLLKPTPCDVEVSVSERPLPPDSRLQHCWRVDIHSIQVVPGSVVKQTSDAVVEAKAFSETPEGVQDVLKAQQTAIAVGALRGAAHTTTVAKGRPAKWDESFEFASLKAEAQKEFQDALGLALDRTVTKAEIENMFPTSLQRACGDDGRRLQQVFATQLFPKITHIDQQDDGSYGLDRFPEDDTLRLLHFGEWLQSNCRGQDSDILVFVLFLMERHGDGRRRSVSRESSLRFAKAFLKAWPSERWSAEVEDVVKSLEGSTGKEGSASPTLRASVTLSLLPLSLLGTSGGEDAVVSRCQAVLRDVAFHTLQEHWITYDLQNQHATFSYFAPESRRRARRAMTADEKLAVENQTICVVDSINANRSGNEELVADSDEPPAQDSAECLEQQEARRRSEEMRRCVGARQTFGLDGLKAEENYSSGETRAAKLASAVPLIFTTLRLAQSAKNRLQEACHGLLGDLTSDEAKVVKRCTYTVPAGGCKYCFSPGTTSLSFEAIGQAQLNRIRHEAGGTGDDVLEQELADPFHPVNLLATNSKSGEVFFASAAGSFVIKTISDLEAHGLIEFIPQYEKHMLGNPRSVLGRYVGLFRIDLGSCGGQRYVTVMQSVFKCPYSVSTMYDIKGSTHHRSAKPGDSVKKDNDWKAEGSCLDLCTEAAQQLLDAHRKDTSLLSSINVMDFSLLVGVAQVPEGDPRIEAGSLPPGCWISKDKSQLYLLGIVDFLVEFGARKRAEHMLHSFAGHGEAASVTDPASYAGRQQQFLQEHMLPLQLVTTVS